MPKFNIKFSPQMKKYVFIGVVLVALVFVVVQFNRNSEFRAAKKAFNEKDYIRAAELFETLGTYSDSDAYASYCRALDSFEKTDYETAQELFEQLGTFQKSAKYFLYSQGMIAYQNSQYWEAASLFEKCGESVLGHTAKKKRKCVTTPPVGSWKQRVTTSEQSYATAWQMTTMMPKRV